MTDRSSSNDRWRGRPTARLGMVALCVALCVTAAPAQQQPAPAGSDENNAERAKREKELQAVKDAMAQGEENRKRLEAEAAAIRGDRAKLNTSLIETAARIKANETRVRDLETRLDTLVSSETAIRASLDKRRDIIAEVLAALQRMGRRPPPAVLVQPEDMLAAVRTSILLGAVLPELREEAEALAGDLAELVRLKNAIVADRKTLQTEMATLQQEQQRLNALMETRQSRLTQTEEQLGGENQRMADLAERVQTLQELINGLETGISGSRHAAEEARRATEAQRRNGGVSGQLAFSDPARLGPKIAFANTKGLLPMPANGRQISRFGDPDAFGSVAHGLSIATRPKAVVVSPADGWVAFAGPFRSFGRLLIINAGDGYYLIFAGMDQINVEVGQFVLAGEPVAIMGEKATSPLTSGTVETTDPVLYIEFKKDGGSIDPSPWWAKIQT